MGRAHKDRKILASFIREEGAQDQPAQQVMSPEPLSSRCASCRTAEFTVNRSLVSEQARRTRNGPNGGAFLRNTEQVWAGKLAERDALS
jgi:hypothetical protein